MFSCSFNVLLKSINCHFIFNLWLSSTTFLSSTSYSSFLCTLMRALSKIQLTKILISCDLLSRIHTCFSPYSHLSTQHPTTVDRENSFKLSVLKKKSIIKLIKVKKRSLSLSFTHSLSLTLSLWYDNKQKEVREKKINIIR